MTGITLKPICVEVDDDNPFKTKVVGIPANSKIKIGYLGPGLSNEEDIEDVRDLIKTSGLPGEIYGSTKQ